MSGVAARSYRPPGPPSGAAALAAATEPPEARGTPADGVRLQVVGDDGIATGTMRDLPEALRAGDLLVANRSAVRKAALDAEVVAGPHAGERRLLHLAQRYGAGVWLVELRPDEATPGPCRLPLGTRLTVHGRILRLWGTYPGLPRLRFAGADDDLASIAEREGRIVRYGHLPRAFGPEAYRTVFGDRPGSAEMASAGRPFTPDLLRRLRQHGVDVATVTLDAGLSGLDAPDDDAELVVPEEPFEVDAAAAAAVHAALARGRRVVAIGTGAARALESAWADQRLRPVRGWTRKVLRPGTASGLLSGIVTGLHGPEATHLRLLASLVGSDRVAAAYRAAVAARLRSHEFGDVQLLWRPRGPGARGALR